MFKLIAFDADDTLWHNEVLFQETERQFAEMLSRYHSDQWVRERLFATEMKNLAHFGYGIKGFILSMIETALELTENRIGGGEIQRILNWGHEMLLAPVDLLDGVKETIEALAPDYRLMLLTKGDLFDQEAKLARSGLGDLFHAVEIVSRKDARTYASIYAKHAVSADQFVMVGNSLKSDVLPALESGAYAVHIPYQTTWAHEVVDEDVMRGKDFARLSSIRDLPLWLSEGPRGGKVSR
jgi:putative hydrolase of the HAD superfamily